MRASAADSNDAPASACLSDRDRRGTVFGGPDVGFGDLDSSANALASARSNAVEHAAADNLLAVGSLHANLQQHRYGMCLSRATADIPIHAKFTLALCSFHERLPSPRCATDARKQKLFKEHDYTYLRENIRKSEDRINRIKSGVSIYEIVELEKQQVKKPNVAMQHVQQQQLRLSHDANSGDYERDFSARDVPTFGGTRERFQPVIALPSDSAQDTVDASTVSERQKKLLQMKQSETQFTLPRDLQGLLAVN
jgi:hypothetical protein